MLKIGREVESVFDCRNALRVALEYPAIGSVGCEKVTSRRRDPCRSRLFVPQSWEG
jgi:hypothetical protein